MPRPAPAPDPAPAAPEPKPRDRERGVRKILDALVIAALIAGLVVYAALDAIFPGPPPEDPDRDP